MKKSFTHILIFVVLTVSGQAQQSSFITAELGLLRNQNGFFRLFDGIVDAGVAYQFSILNKLYGGASFHAGFLNYQNTSAKSVLYRPHLSLQYSIHLSPRIAMEPQAGIGYAFVRITNQEYNYKNMQTGVNYSGTLKLRWKSEGKLDYYLFGRYDFIYLNKDDDFTQLEYYRRIQIFAFGLGLHIKPGKYE
ncbi:MAG: hypothetical protein KQI35_13665 [Bacteroidetes bacterium]|nr:hypothetical protein [Bacteroidota bacterium]